MPLLTESEIIDRLSHENYCLFFGAGVSRGTGLPLGNELGAMILEALGVSRSEAEELSNLYHLERMLFLMKAYLGDSIHGAYSALSTTIYGTNHVILGSLLAQKGIPLLTTNQDVLIEEALGTHLTPSILVKIHGSISDQNSLRITLDRVSALDTNLLSKLLQTAQNRLVVVLGYSFSDYDLKDFFQMIRDRVYFLDYNGNGNDFLKNHLWNGNIAAYDGHRFVSSAERFLSNLANQSNVNLRQTGNQNTGSVSGGAVARVRDWASQYPAYLKEMATCCLYQGMWKGTKTLGTMRNIASDSGVPATYRALAFAEAARASEGTSSYKTQKKLIKSLRNVGLDIMFKNLLYHLSLAAYHHIHDNPISWWRAYHAYSTAQSLSIHIQEASPFVDHVNFAKNYQKNIDHGIASSIEKLNRVHVFKSRLDEALKLVSSYTRNDISCDLDFLCEALFVHGKLCLRRSDTGQAEVLYTKALEIAKWIKKDHSIDQALRGLARISGLTGNYDDALSYLDNSWEIAEKTEEPTLKARNLLTRSWIHKRRSESKKARACKIEGLSIYKQHRGRILGFLDGSLYLLGKG